MSSSGERNPSTSTPTSSLQGGDSWIFMVISHAFSHAFSHNVPTRSLVRWLNPPSSSPNHRGLQGHGRSSLPAVQVDVSEWHPCASRGSADGWPAATGGWVGPQRVPVEGTCLFWRKEQPTVPFFFFEDGTRNKGCACPGRAEVAKL